VLKHPPSRHTHARTPQGSKFMIPIVLTTPLTSHACVHLSSSGLTSACKRYMCMKRTCDATSIIMVHAKFSTTVSTLDKSVRGLNVSKTSSIMWNKVPYTAPCSWLVLARNIINKAVPLETRNTNLKRTFLYLHRHQDSIFLFSSFYISSRRLLPLVAGGAATSGAKLRTGQYRGTTVRAELGRCGLCCTTTVAKSSPRQSPRLA
jgi:hypothetical protein